MLELSAYNCILYLLASTVKVMGQTKRMLHFRTEDDSQTIQNIKEDLFKSINFQDTDQAIVFEDFEFSPTNGLPF